MNKSSSHSRNRIDKNEPKLPRDIDIEELPLEVLEELKSLEKKNSVRVGKHILLANYLLDTDPKSALDHAIAAKNHAARIGVVRETLGICAYRNQEWQLALSELRAAKRISGTFELDPLIADCLRALNRPDQAIEIVTAIKQNKISLENYVELQIIHAGALKDLDRAQEGLEILSQFISEKPTLDVVLKSRLIFAYADLLESAENLSEAKIWFSKLVDLPTQESDLAKIRLEKLHKDNSNG